MSTIVRIGDGQTQERRIPAPPPVAILTTFALLLSGVAASPGIVPGDVAITRWVQGTPYNLLSPVFHLINTIGETPMMLVIGAVLAVISWRLRRIDALLLIAGATFARAANPLLKAIFASPRPTSDRVRVEEVASGLGFPSGHVMGMTLLVGTLVYLSWTTWSGRRQRTATLVIATLVLLMSGAGRIAVGAHWPTDVLGGYLYGSLGVIGLAWSWRYLESRSGSWVSTSSISFGWPQSISVSPRTIVTAVRTRSEGVLSVNTLVVRRRRLSVVAFGGILAALIVYVSGAAAQTPATTGEYSARIIAGSCADTSAAAAYELKSATLTGSDDDDDDNDDAPSGNPVGAAGAIPVAASGNNLTDSLNTLTAQPHAIVVTSGAADAPVVACGEIGGQLRGDDDLIIGLAPVGGASTSGLAFLDGDDDDNDTDVTVYVISY